MSQWHGLWNLQTLEAAVFVFGWTRTSVLQATTEHLSHCSSDPVMPSHHLFTTALCLLTSSLKKGPIFTPLLQRKQQLPRSAPCQHPQMTLSSTPYTTHLGRPWLHLFFQRPHHFPQAHWCFNLGDFQNSKLLTEQYNEPWKQLVERPGSDMRNRAQRTQLTSL